MKISEKQFDKALKIFSAKSLSSSQKRAMLSSIYSAGEKPAIQSFFFPGRLVFSVAAILIVMLSGTAYASAKSLPGDLLYGMKVNVIEPVGLAFRFSQESRNQYKLLLLQKRVQELEELERLGRLDENSQKASSRAVDKNVKELESSAIFNLAGQNIEVSEKVEMYNKLVTPDLRVSTSIEIDGGLPDYDIPLLDVESEAGVKLDVPKL